MLFLACVFRFICDMLINLINLFSIMVNISLSTPISTPINFVHIQIQIKFYDIDSNIKIE